MTDPDPKVVGEGLTEAQRRAVAETFTGSWVAGPTLPDEALSEIAGLEEHKLLERRFMDEGPPRHSVGDGSITVRLSACWHFRLTPLGLAVRSALQAKEPSQ